MSIMAKCNANFVWLTPAGMKIIFALGKVTSKRAGKGIIKSGSGVQINIIDKSKIDIPRCYKFHLNYDLVQYLLI